MEEKVKGDTVKVTVIKASDLVRKHMMAKPDPFVRFGVLQKGGNPSSLKDETKTPVIKDDFNPSWGMFDHTFQVGEGDAIFFEVNDADPKTKDAKAFMGQAIVEISGLKHRETDRRDLTLEKSSEHQKEKVSGNLTVSLLYTNGALEQQRINEEQQKLKEKKEQEDAERKRQEEEKAKEAAQREKEAEEDKAAIKQHLLDSGFEKLIDTPDGSKALDAAFANKKVEARNAVAKELWEKFGNIPAEELTKRAGTPDDPVIAVLLTIYANLPAPQVEEIAKNPNGLLLQCVKAHNHLNTPSESLMSAVNGIFYPANSGQGFKKLYDQIKDTNLKTIHAWYLKKYFGEQGDQIIKMSGPKHDKGNEQTIADLKILSRSFKHLKPPHGPLAMMIDKLFANANVNISSSRAMIGRSGDMGYAAWAFLDALKPLGTDPNVYAVVCQVDGPVAQVVKSLRREYKNSNSTLEELDYCFVDPEKYKCKPGYIDPVPFVGIWRSPAFSFIKSPTTVED